MSRRKKKHKHDETKKSTIDWHTVLATAIADLIVGLIIEILKYLNS